MNLSSRTGRLAVLAVGVLLAAGLLTVCGDRSSQQDSARKAEAERQEQLQAQFQAEQAQRLAAEKAARATESSRDAWIVGIGAGACVVCGLVFLIGIHIGSRSLGRSRKETSDG